LDSSGVDFSAKFVLSTADILFQKTMEFMYVRDDSVDMRCSC